MSDTDLKATSSGVDLTASPTVAAEDAHNRTDAKSDDKLNHLTPAEQAQWKADPTPMQEAAAAGNNVGPVKGNPTPMQYGKKGTAIDASGLNVTTNQEVIDNFPTNENGQVEIDENGQIKGLDKEKQPRPATS
jgi:hypothetical protein